MNNDIDTPDEKRLAAPCWICGETLDFNLARGRKSGKPYLSLVCPRDPRHCRLFCHDREVVSKIQRRLEQIS